MRVAPVRLWLVEHLPLPGEKFCRRAPVGLVIVPPVGLVLVEPVGLVPVEPVGLVLVEPVGLVLVEPVGLGLLLPDWPFCVWHLHLLVGVHW